MRWVFEHLQLVIAVAGAIGYWLTQQKAAAARDEQRNAPPPSQADPAQEERTRRVQEEIRRKIADRRGGVQPPMQAPATTARPLASPVLAPRPVAAGGGLRERLESKLAQAQARETARTAEQDRRKQLETQVRKLEAQRALVEKRAADISQIAREEGKASAVAQTAADTLAARGSRAWLDDLRDPRSARRAMVLREVLGEPVGLR